MELKPRNSSKKNINQYPYREHSHTSSTRVKNQVEKIFIGIW